MVNWYHMYEVVRDSTIHVELVLYEVVRDSTSHIELEPYEVVRLVPIMWNWYYTKWSDQYQSCETGSI